MQISSFSEKLNSKTGRKKRFFSAALLFISVFLLSSPVFAVDDGWAGLRPVEEVPLQKIFFEQPESPLWFLEWQEARRLARTGDVSGAIGKYEIVLSEGRFFSQASWECVSLLLSVNALDKAQTLLESLIEDYPFHSDYLNALGFVLHEKGHFERSAELFGRCLDVDPQNIFALAGLRQAYLSLDQPEKSLPYTESLHVAQPDNALLFEELFVLYVELGLFEKARPFAMKLSRNENVSTLNLERAAFVHDALGLKNIAEDLWKKVLAREKNYQKAHFWLARYYEDSGRCNDALEHLLFLQRQEPDKPELLSRIGNCYLEQQKPSLALPYFEKFLVLSPGDKDVVRHLVNIHASLGHEDATLSALDLYFQVEPDPTASNLKKAATLYDSAGRYHDAIPIYRRLLKLNPDDPDVLATLAQDLLSIGENEGALAIWAHLATVSPDSKEIYLAMTDLLIRLGRLEETIPLLEELKRLDPLNVKNTLQLVLSYLQTAEFDKGEALFLEVREKEIFSKDLLTIRAQIFEKLEMFDHALTDYEEIIRSGSESLDLHKKCIAIAGKLGKRAVVKRHAVILEKNQIGWHDYLLLANAFRDSGDFRLAHSRYNTIFDNAALDMDLTNMVLLEKARLFQIQGLFFEAEQSLRMALLDNVNRAEVLIQLVDLQLDKGLTGDADLWLTQLRYVENSGVNGDISETGFFNIDIWRKILTVKRFNADKKYTAAIRIAKEMIVEIDSNKKKSVSPDIINLIHLELGKAYLGDEQFTEAEKECVFLLSTKNFYLHAYFLCGKIYAAQGNEKKYQENFRQTMAVAEEDLSRMLTLMVLCEGYQEWQLLERIALWAMEKHYESFTVSFFLVRSLSESGQLVRARDILNEMELSYPESLWLKTVAADVAFRMGLYQEALSYSETVVSGQPERADMQLLHARVLWRTNHWTDSLRIYDEFLSVPVSDILQKRAKLSGIKLPEIRKPPFWQRFPFSVSSGDQAVDHLMAPSVAGSVEVELNHLTAPLYAKYKWQKRFREEFTARNAVKQGDYFQAAKLFSQLINEFPENESLKFDLAGIYSKLDRLADEALLYELLAKADYLYPDLEEAKNRNMLKRQPRLNISYDSQKIEGRDGYKAIKKDSVELASRVSLRSGDDGDVLFSRIRYSSPDTDDSLMASRVFAAYEASNLANAFGVRFGAGIESLSGGFAETGLLECGVSGKLGDRVEGEFKYVRDVVSDTLASLKRNIVFEDMYAGFYLGILPRLLTGARYGYTSYSDGNEVSGYALWTSYSITPEPTALRFKFQYDFKNTSEKDGPSLPFAEDGFRVDDSPYWTPKNYWKNSFGLEWKHNLSRDALERGTPSYYCAEYLLDYDSDGHAFQTIKGSLAIELAANFMLESSIELVSSDEYRSRDFSLSAVYRW